MAAKLCVLGDPQARVPPIWPLFSEDSPATDVTTTSTPHNRWHSQERVWARRDLCSTVRGLIRATAF